MMKDEAEQPHREPSRPRRYVDSSWMRLAHLVETDWVMQLLDCPGVRIIDVRGKVLTHTAADGTQTAEYRGARDDYHAGHIPGAIYLDWTEDIVDPEASVQVQILPPDRARKVFSTAGIGPRHLVVLYDDHPASQFATRLWWVLTYYTHLDVRVMNGGLRKWKAEGKPLVPGQRARPRWARFQPRARPEILADADEVRRHLHNPEITLIDARDEGQYSGVVCRGPRGGHIPGAIHIPRETLFKPDGTFKSTRDLIRIFTSAGVVCDRRTVAYCNGGVAATTVLFALSMIGHTNWANYDGSWNEWGAREDLPVEMGG